MTISVKLDTSKLDLRIRRQQQALAQLPGQALDQFRRLTPIKSGNARSNTDLSGNNKQIIANYAYAQRLDNNWSRQTRGQGMVKPFKAWWIKQIKRIAGLK